MNESDLENQLRALKPAAPSARLADRIARDLAATPTRAPRAGVIAAERPPNWLAQYFSALGWIAVTALVIFSVWFGFQAPSSKPGSAPVAANSPEQQPEEIAVTAPLLDPLQAVESSRELVQASEDELLLDEDQEPSRRLRFTFVERQTWTDPESGALIEVEIPRQDVLIVPVAMQ